MTDKEQAKQYLEKLLAAHHQRIDELKAKGGVHNVGVMYALQDDANDLADAIVVLRDTDIPIP